MASDCFYQHRMENLPEEGVNTPFKEQIEKCIWHAFYVSCRYFVLSLIFLARNWEDINNVEENKFFHFSPGLLHYEIP